jgi:hypothetical protein
MASHKCSRGRPLSPASLSRSGRTALARSRILLVVSTSSLVLIATLMMHISGQHTRVLYLERYSFAESRPGPNFLRGDIRTWCCRPIRLHRVLQHQQTGCCFYLCFDNYDRICSYSLRLISVDNGHIHIWNYIFISSSHQLDKQQHPCDRPGRRSWLRASLHLPRRRVLLPRLQKEAPDHRSLL